VSTDEDKEAAIEMNRLLLATLMRRAIDKVNRGEFVPTEKPPPEPPGDAPKPPEK